jgi:hypothetical protein
MAASFDIDNKFIENSIVFVNSLKKHFVQSVSEHRQVIRYLCIDNFIIKLWFANETLVEVIVPALVHLEVEHAEKVDLTICLWDSQSTQSPIVAPPWPHPYYTDRGEIIHANNQRVYSLMDLHTRALNVLDKEQNIAFYWTQELADLPWWASGSPLQYIIHWWSFGRGYQLTHAAGVGLNDKAVLLTGKGGSGKSTTTIACLQAGFNYFSEDYCLLQESSHPKIHSVYNSAKVTQQTLDFFPELIPYIANKNRQPAEKALIFQQQIYPDRIRQSAKLQAILVPSVKKVNHSWLEPIAIDEVLTALTVTTMWQLIRSSVATFNRLKAIAKVLPAYRLHLGSDFKNIPKVIGSLL